jgi:alcohol dehydrogenase class IV
MTRDYQVKTHIAFSPNKVILGFGSSAMVADEVRYLRWTKVLLVTDPGVTNAGLVKSIEESLQTENIPYVLYDKVEPEPSSRIIDTGAAIFKSEACDLIVGVGGGSSLDVAKGISILAANKGRILDYIGIDNVPNKGAKMILLPHVMRFNLPGNPDKYTNIAQLLGKNIDGLSPLESASLSVEAVLELEEAIAVSSQLKDYNIPEDDLSLLVDGAMKQARLFVPNPRDLTGNDVRSIYQQAFEPDWCLNESYLS